MHIRKGTNRTGETLGLFRTKLTQGVRPVDGTEPDNNDLQQKLLFESLFARIQRLEQELEQREQARSGMRSNTVTPWLSDAASEQDTAGDPQKKLKKAIESYEKASQFNTETQ